MLRASGVRVAFPDARGRRFPVLDIDDLAFAPGALTVVAGPSGSGKSTLLHVLAGLHPPDTGHVHFADIDLYALSESRRDGWRLRNVGMVFQDFHLLPDLTPLANVTVAASFSRASRDIARRGRMLLDELGVPPDRRSVEDLSRGERQRVALARALLFDPPILLADEPTASLDGAAGEAAFALLQGLARGGRTVVMATHDPKFVGAVDAVVTLQHTRDTAAREAAA